MRNGGKPIILMFKPLSRKATAQFSGVPYDDHEERLENADMLAQMIEQNRPWPTLVFGAQTAVTLFIFAVGFLWAAFKIMGWAGL